MSSEPRDSFAELLQHARRAAGLTQDKLAPRSGLAPGRSGMQPDGEPRFDLFETIREFGLGQITVAGEEQAMRGSHAGYFAGRAERADKNMRSTRSSAGITHYASGESVTASEMARRAKT